MVVLRYSLPLLYGNSRMHVKFCLSCFLGWILELVELSVLELQPSHEEAEGCSEEIVLVTESMVDQLSLDLTAKS